jgi:hypothetical protein
MLRFSKREHKGMSLSRAVPTRGDACAMASHSTFGSGILRVTDPEPLSSIFRTSPSSLPLGNGAQSPDG